MIEHFDPSDSIGEKLVFASARSVRGQSNLRPCRSLPDILTGLRKIIAANGILSHGPTAPAKPRHSTRLPQCRSIPSTANLLTIEDRGV